MTYPIEELKAKYDAGEISSRDAGFASNLISAHERYGNLSAKQAYWVERLVNPPKPDSVDVGDFAGVIELFKKAGENIKYPKIKLVTEDGEPVRLNVAGPNAKRPGTVNVTDGGPWGANTWYGRVNADGSFEKSGSATGSVVKILKRLAEDPNKVAAEYGTYMNECCFCGKGLNDERSIAAGYGPTCAKNFGLYDEWKKASS